MNFSDGLPVNGSTKRILYFSLLVAFDGVTTILSSAEISWVVLCPHEMNEVKKIDIATSHLKNTVWQVEPVETCFGVEIWPSTGPVRHRKLIFEMASKQLNNQKR